MEETREEQGKKFAKLIAKAWSDESFKETLLADSRTVLEAEGISVPPGVDIKILEETDTQLFIVIPKIPDGVTITEYAPRIPAVWACGGCHCCH